MIVNVWRNRWRFLACLVALFRRPKAAVLPPRPQDSAADGAKWRVQP